ncbi:carbon-phosphorus lyase complex subunit PhnI [Herbivorax sp. ANBcel31]|nr:carbon-phosphorus lyase complex subunit PhnI [Herbivorax sp. ANBcel31]MDQ2086752.1 carbon-phosphorus lyase complex subunit PhnI [Herbivorax sp. ANBcel31]
MAVKGGTKAIEESIKMLKYERVKNKKILDVADIEGGMRCLTDQVMSEASLYNKKLAAISIKQAEGSPEEAVFLMRAYRSTLQRKHYSKTINTDYMKIERRISASFKDILGGQILGPCYDYTHRLIDFQLQNETLEECLKWLYMFEEEKDLEQDKIDLNMLGRVSDYLRVKGLIKEMKINNEVPDDITKKSISFPSSRSQRLQTLSRGQTGAITSLGYASLRGFGSVHPTVGELRVGNIPIYIDNPFGEEKNDEDSYYIGEIRVTEVETLIPKEKENNETGKKELEFDIGYGLCLGQNETKAIAMSILDQCLETGDKSYATHNEEFVLLHVDSVEATGFISHLKLPHYVTFKSKMDSVVKSKNSN